MSAAMVELARYQVWQGLRFGRVVCRSDHLIGSGLEDAEQVWIETSCGLLVVHRQGPTWTAETTPAALLMDSGPILGKLLESLREAVGRKPAFDPEDAVRRVLAGTRAWYGPMDRALRAFEGILEDAKRSARG